MTTHHQRQFPVVLVTGTPGTGKTLHSTLIASDSSVPMTHLNIGDIVKSKGFHEGYDETWQSYTVDEDRLLDYLEEVINPADGAAQTGEFIPLRYALVQTSRSAVQMGSGWKRDRADRTSTGFILDHHDPSLFPERWVDLAVVLRCDNKVLHERLTERKYPEAKLTENMTAEIMLTCLTETRESYAEEIIVELQSDGSGGDNEVEENVGRIIQWIDTWRADRISGKHDEED